MSLANFISSAEASGDLKRKKQHIYFVHSLVDFGFLVSENFEYLSDSIYIGGDSKPVICTSISGELSCICPTL